MKRLFFCVAPIGAYIPIIMPFPNASHPSGARAGLLLFRAYAHLQGILVAPFRALTERAAALFKAFFCGAIHGAHSALISGIRDSRKSQTKLDNLLQT